MITLTDILVCEECGLKFSKCGIMSHIRSKHKMTYAEYREKYNLIEKNISKSKKVKEHKKTGKQLLQKQFANLQQDLKNEIINLYKTGKTSIKEISEKYEIDHYLIKMVFEEQNVEINKNICGQKIKEKYKNKLQEKFIEFSKTNDGRNVVEDYNNPLNTLRILSEKYKINRYLLHKYLEFSGIHVRTNKEAKREIFLINKQNGIHGHRFGKPTNGGHVSWFFYKGFKFQGSWEFKYGLWLESQNIDFKHHEGVKRFVVEVDGKMTTYCPDFYLEKQDEYHETKGYFSELAKKKFKAAQGQYSNTTFVLIDKQKFLDLDIFNIDKKLNVKIEDYIYSIKNQTFQMDVARKNLPKEIFAKEYYENLLSIKEIGEKYNIPLINQLFNAYQFSFRPPKYTIEAKVKVIGDSLKFDFSSGKSICELSRKYKMKRHNIVKALKTLNVSLA